MSIYEANMQSLRRCYPDISHCIDYMEKHDKNKKVEEIETSHAKDGSAITSIFFNGKIYRLNSAYRPMEEATRWAEQFDMKHERAVFMMYGFGNGYFTRALLHRMIKMQSMIIYEPSKEMFAHTLQHFDITDMIENKQVILIIEDMNDEILKSIIFTTVDIYNFFGVEQCMHPSYDKIYGESCIKYYKEVKQALTSVQVNINTEVLHGLKSNENIIKNISYYNNSITLKQMKSKIPKDVPAIVVAAGPSLAENLEWLKKSKGRAVIFAVDRVIDYLLDEGIEPDFLVTIDPIKDVRYFSQRDNLTIPLICYTNSNNDTVSKHKGRKIFCNINSFVTELYHVVDKEPQRLESSGSVAIVAYTACVELGFQRVILVGQDLAFQGEISHVGGKTSTKSEKANVYVEDLNGNQIKSRYDWREFILRYEELIKKYDSTEVIDVKNVGARIKGTELMPFSEVLDKFCIQEFEAATLFEDIEPLLTNDDISKIKNYLERNLSDLNYLKEKAIKGSKLCDKQLKAINSNYNSDHFNDTNKKIKKINHQIEKKKIYNFLDAIVVSKANKDLSNILSYTDVENDDLSITYSKAKNVYEAIIEAVDITRENIMQAIK